MGKFLTVEASKERLKWKLKFLPTCLIIKCSGIIFHSWKLPYNFLIQEQCRVIIFLLTSTFFSPPSSNVLQVFCDLFLVKKISIRSFLNTLNFINILIVSTIKSTNFNPQTAFTAPFRRTMLVMLHLLMFDFKLENYEKVWKISIGLLTESLYPSKNVRSSAYAVNKKQWSKFQYL